ncbi:hypothetical protein Tel_12745 [Candidatus Tenderia electrophaga]|jgi:two-component system response regulator FixJ|uniref:LuxR family transcriptional regulator n=1 Tax=Candidatus Tenderia electrophaga TaxID=1748243 RepID=A0A0S2TFK1_9GAMM|nr:hypothetical protein Tel_12745 [Candidatus Tenderia electrophaga]
MTGTVYIVEDDAALRDALCQLLEEAGFRVQTYADGPAFLAQFDADCHGCVILDMAMPGLSGAEVQAAMTETGHRIPVIFLTGHGTIPMAVQALQAGAVDFLEKPVRGKVLLERVRGALALAEDRRESTQQQWHAQQSYERLTPRERQVMSHVTEGLSSKEIARALDLSPRTVEVHRANIMRKLGASNLAELIKLSDLCPTKTR